MYSNLFKLFTCVPLVLILYFAFIEYVGLMYEVVYGLVPSIKTYIVNTKSFNLFSFKNCLVTLTFCSSGLWSSPELCVHYISQAECSIQTNVFPILIQFFVSKYFFPISGHENMMSRAAAYRDPLLRNSLCFHPPLPHPAPLWYLDVIAHDLNDVTSWIVKRAGSLALFALRHRCDPAATGWMSDVTAKGPEVHMRRLRNRSAPKNGSLREFYCERLPRKWARLLRAAWHRSSGESSSVM